VNSEEKAILTGSAKRESPEVVPSSALLFQSPDGCGRGWGVGVGVGEKEAVMGCPNNGHLGDE
jgi:hypothetical protein